MESRLRPLEDPELGEEQRADMKRHDEELALLGKAIGTRVSYAKALNLLGRFLEGKPFQEATERSLKSFMASLNERYSPGTVRLYMSKVKAFYRWLGGGETPRPLRWYKAKAAATKGDRKLESLIEKMVTQDEYEALIQVCNNPMHKALIAAAWDTGARAAELLAMRIKDLDVASDYPSAIVGKGKRTVPLIESLPHLIQWLNTHPHKDNPDASVWWGQQGPLSYQGFATLLNAKSKKAGLKRRIHAHMFRHRRATEHAKAGVSPYAMNQAMGWVGGSKQWQIYHHLDGKDVIDGIRRAYGLDVEKRKAEKPKFAKCPRCQEDNPPENIYCFRCGFALKDEEAKEAAEITEKIDDLQNRVAAVLARRPDLLQIIKEELKKEKE